MKELRLLSLALLTNVAVLSGCSGGGSANPPPPPPQPPSISSISPTSATAGGTGFTLTVNGLNFASGATLLWTSASNANPPGHATTFVSATQLTAQITGPEIAFPGTVQVTVQNPGVATASNAVSFAINTAPAGVTQTISVGTGGATSNGNSHDPALSANGRFVAFSSEATNLISPSTSFAEAYVRDTCLGINGCTPSTQLISAVNHTSTEGNAPGGATPSISSQGRMTSFVSVATNLVSPNTKTQQAFFRDTCIGAAAGCTVVTSIVSLTGGGNEPNGPAMEVAMGANGCTAAFASAATDVAIAISRPNEIYLFDDCPASSGPSFVLTGRLVSADSAGLAANQGAQQPAISADGRFVAFASISSNLPGAPGGGIQQVYVRDTCNHGPAGCTPATTLVSIDGSTGNPFTGSSQVPAISRDGRFVAFSTQVPLAGGGITSIVSLRDTCQPSSGPVTGCTASTTTISVAAGGGAANGPSSSSRHAISGDGRLVVFDSSATNLLTSATTGNQVFVRDTCKSSGLSISGCTPRTVLLSVDSMGNAIGGFRAAISDDGHFAAFGNETTIFQVFLAATGF